jgi:hypothetical protein
MSKLCSSKSRMACEEEIWKQSAVSCDTSMRSMRSMRGDLFSVVEGSCKRYAIAPTRMSEHQIVNYRR